MSAVGNVHGIAEYRCNQQIVRDPGSSYTSTFYVSVPAVSREETSQTEIRLLDEAEKKLRDVVNGCPRGKTLVSLRLAKNNGEIRRASKESSWPVRAAHALGNFISKITKNAIELQANLHMVQRAFDH